MTTRTAVAPAAATTSGAPAARAVAKTAEFKDALGRAQAAFPAASARAARSNERSLALMAQAQLQAQAQQASRPAAPQATSHALGPARPATREVAARLPMPASASGGDAFRARIAALETGNAADGGYGARNAASGALGRYQFMAVALRDIGWQDAAGNWTATAAARGVRGAEDFLGNPAAQEAAMSRYLERKAEMLNANGAMSAVGSVLRGLDGEAVPVTESGLVAAAHRRGAGTVARWLRHRTETPDAPVPEAQRAAFNNVEARLRDFARLPLSRGGNLAGVDAGGRPAI